MLRILPGQGQEIAIHPVHFSCTFKTANRGAERPAVVIMTSRFKQLNIHCYHERYGSPSQYSGESDKITRQDNHHRRFVPLLKIEGLSLVVSKSHPQISTTSGVVHFLTIFFVSLIVGNGKKAKYNCEQSRSIFDVPKDVNNFNLGTRNYALYAPVGTWEHPKVICGYGFRSRLQRDNSDGRGS